MNFDYNLVISVISTEAKRRKSEHSKRNVFEAEEFQPLMKNGFPFT